MVHARQSFIQVFFLGGSQATGEVKNLGNSEIKLHIKLKIWGLGSLAGVDPRVRPPPLYETLARLNPISTIMPLVFVSSSAGSWRPYSLPWELIRLFCSCANDCCLTLMVFPVFEEMPGLLIASDCHSTRLRSLSFQEGHFV